AYAIREHYYPGINCATLSLVLGREDYAGLAQDVLDSLARPESQDGPLWPVATRAEALLLRGDCQAAEAFYRQVVRNPDCLQHYKTAMRRQVELIRQYHSDEVRAYWT